MGSEMCIRDSVLLVLVRTVLLLLLRLLLLPQFLRTSSDAPLQKGISMAARVKGGALWKNNMWPTHNCDLQRMQSEWWRPSSSGCAAAPAPATAKLNSPCNNKVLPDTRAERQDMS